MTICPPRFLLSGFHHGCCPNAVRRAMMIRFEPMCRDLPEAGAGGNGTPFPGLLSNRRTEEMP
jgi:hypothetical protein